MLAGLAITGEHRGPDDVVELRLDPQHIALELLASPQRPVALYYLAPLALAGALFFAIERRAPAAAPAR